MWERDISSTELAREGSWIVERYIDGPATGRLPSAYGLVRLGELVRELREMVHPPFPAGRQIPYVGLEHIEPLTGDLVGYAPRPAEQLRSRSKLFRAGHVLYGRLRPGLNKVYLAEASQVDGGLCSGELLVLEADSERVLPRVLRQLLATPFVCEQAVRLQSGAALPRISAADLLDLRVPVPPLDHQRRLDRALAAADERRRALREELTALPRQTMRAFLDALHRGDPDPTED